MLILQTHTVFTIQELALSRSQGFTENGYGRLLILSIGVAAFALVTQAVMSVAIAFIVMRTSKEVLLHTRDFKDKALALLASSHGLMNDLAPEVRKMTSAVAIIATQAEAMAIVSREKVVEIAPTVSAVNETVKAAHQDVQTFITKARSLVVGINATISGVIRAGR